VWGISEIEGDVLRGDLEVLADKVSVGGFGLADTRKSQAKISM